MKKIEVWHIVDGTIRVDVIETEGPVNAKIHKSKKTRDRRGYVKTADTERLYRSVEFISIDDAPEG